jgi:hypothetical protein
MERSLTRLLTWLRGEFVGTDSYGNRYYRERGAAPLRRGGGRARRSDGSSTMASRRGRRCRQSGTPGPITP